MASGHMSENRDTEVGADQPVGPEPGRTRRGFMSTAGAMGVARATSLQAINNEARARGQPIPLGSMLPLTGWGAADGVAFQADISLAVEEINAIGGVRGRPIEMVFEDTKEVTPETGTRAARRLIDRHGVHAIVNGYKSPSQRAEYDILRQQIYRGVVGAIRYLPGVQAAASCPASTKDPSLGTPAHMVQCQNWREEVALVGPEPYATAEWMTPPWLA